MATHHITADVAVVGLGAMGSATLYQLAKRGVRVVGIDRFHPPHLYGSSHGETRITRQAIGEGDVYVPLALRSHAIWDELEAETGEQLINRCGFVAMASHDEAMVHHGKTGFVEATIAAARRHGIAHDVLTAAEVSYRFPQFVGLEGNERCYFEPGGGYVRPEMCISAQLRLAERSGAQLLLNTQVVSVRVGQGSVHITTQAGTIVAGHAVIAAGAWIKPFLPAVATSHIGVYRQVAHWLPITEPARFRDDAPVFIWHHGPAPDDQIYGFPPLEGANEIKCAGETYAHPTEPDADWSFVTTAEADAFVRTHVASRIAGVASSAARSSACLYTVVNDGDFLIDRLADDSPITLVSACSGHGFKHSAAIGEAVATSIASNVNHDLFAAFQLARFGPQSTH